MTTVLVIGATGFVGSHILVAPRAKPHMVPANFPIGNDLRLLRTHHGRDSGDHLAPTGMERILEAKPEA